MGKKDERKEALLKARRKFLKLTTGATGALLLSSCGGQFVKPVRKKNDLLKITLDKANADLASLITALHNDAETRRRFALEPMQVMSEFGLVRGIEPSQAERLLLYVSSNKSLVQSLAKPFKSAAIKSKISTRAMDIHTYDKSVDRVVTDLIGTRSGKRILEDQLTILLEDPGVRQILNVPKLEDTRAYVEDAVKYASSSGAEGEQPNFTLAIVAVGVAALVLVKAILISQVAAIANVVEAVNVYHQVNTITKSNTSGAVQPNSRETLAIHQWEIITRTLGRNIQHN